LIEKLKRQLKIYNFKNTLENDVGDNVSLTFACLLKFLGNLKV
jgi:hypothetical protein